MLTQAAGEPFYADCLQLKLDVEIIQNLMQTNQQNSLFSTW